MSSQHATAQPKCAAIIRRVAAEIAGGVDHHALPLADISLTIEIERGCYRLKQIGNGALVACSKGDSNGEFLLILKIDRPGQRDIAVLGGGELPVHFKVIHQ